ncbi:MAG: acyl-CoA thioesterase II [Pseudomonadales bacterium]
MSDLLPQLINLLELEKIEIGLYRGESRDPGWGRVYGGQVIGQALAAAYHEVPDDRRVHSLHCYFLRMGDPESPIVYDVETIRDGGSVSTRRVRAIQHGKPIYYMTASFQVGRAGYEHQQAMPEVAMPGSIDIEEYKELFRQQAVGTHLEEVYAHVGAIESCPAKPFEEAFKLQDAGEQYNWIRPRGDMPAGHFVHEAVLAYASDMFLLQAATLPHLQAMAKSELQMATIDHSMWFHREVKFDDWLLYGVKSHSASSGRGFSRGEIFNRQGELLVSTAQEGVIRTR